MCGASSFTPVEMYPGASQRVGYGNEMSRHKKLFWSEMAHIGCGAGICEKLRLHARNTLPHRVKVPMRDYYIFYIEGSTMKSLSCHKPLQTIYS